MVMRSQSYQYILEHGPATREELPAGDISTADRQRGIWKFGPTGKGNGSSRKSGGKLLAVYYHREEHTPHEVIEAWIKTNRENFEKGNIRGIRHRALRFDSTMEDAVRDLICLEEGPQI